MALTIDFENFIDSVQQVPRLFWESAKDPMLLAMIRLFHLLPEYPPEKPRDHIAWDSEKQRRWYYWAVNSGQLENPYRRTNTLKDSMMPHVEVQGDELLGTLVVEADYGMFVLGFNDDPKEKAAIHQGRWWVFDEEIEKHYDEALEGFWDDTWKAVAADWDG
jgi:hypothetical protein